MWLAAGATIDRMRAIRTGVNPVGGCQLKRLSGEPRGAQSLTQAGIEKVSQVEGIYLGIEVAPLIAEVQRCLHEDRGEFPRIELHF